MHIAGLSNLVFFIVTRPIDIQLTKKFKAFIAYWAWSTGEKHVEANPTPISTIF